MSEWQATTLGDVCELKRGYDLPQRDRRDGPYPIISSSGTTGYHAEAKAKGPGVVTGRYGTLGEVFLVNEDFWPLNTSLYVRDFKGNEPRFLAALLRSMDLAQHDGAAAVPGLNRNQLHQLPVLCPDRNTQLRISNILGAIDDLIENNRRRIELLEEMAQAIYREWFVHFRYPGHEDATFVDSPLGPIPDDWGTLRFGELVDLMKKTVDPSEIVGGSVLVGLEHIPRRRLTLDSWEQADEVGSRKALFSKGEILFGKIRPYFHKVSLAPVDGYCSSDAMVFRPKPGLDALATLIAFSQEFVDLASATANGTKMPRANWDVLAAHEVPVPSQQLLDAFTALFSTSMEQCTAMMFANKRLSSIRDLLLPKLVTGEIDVSELDLGVLAEGVS